MKSNAKHYGWSSKLVWLLFLIFSGIAFRGVGQQTLSGSAEPTFALFQTKTGVYTNVTVTKRTKDWVFILHSKGVCNIKTSDLSPEMLLTLGYNPSDDADEKKHASGSAQPLAKLTRLKLADVKQFATDWRQNGKQRFEQKIGQLKAGDRSVLYLFLAILGGIHLLVSALFWLICRKTHSAPGPLIWLPVFQLIPLLRAANMPWPWFFAYFIPVLNIVAQIVWCVKIVKSRGKSPVVTFFLLFPFTSLFAFLYLAFSSSAPVEMRSNEVMVLDFA